MFKFCREIHQTEHGIHLHNCLSCGVPNLITTFAPNQQNISVAMVWGANGTFFFPLAQSVGHLTHKSGVLGSIPGRATYFRFSFRFFKKGSCQLLAKVCARSTG